MALKNQCMDANRQCVAQSSEMEHLQHELKSASREIQSLKDKMQLQRESAAASLNRIQKQGNDKSTELHTKIQQLSEQVREVVI